MNDLKAELRRLYADASKHSVYQNVPDFVSAELGYTESIDEAWRSDRPRLAYLMDHRKPLPGETWLDFGANTGFFTLSLAHAFPRSTFVAVEANPNHARFIGRIAQHFEMQNVQVVRKAVDLGGLRSLPHNDFMLHLNVLHHAGSDFDAGLLTDQRCFSAYAQSYLAALGNIADAMLFQIGFNWKGDPSLGLFANGTKAEMIDFISRSAADRWEIERIGIAERYSEGVRYMDVSSLNIVRDDSLGEFLNRPLFIMQAR